MSIQMVLESGLLSQPRANCEPIRVVHLLPNLRTGGMERLIVEMAKHADRSRTSPQVVCIGERGQLATEAEKFGVEVIALDLPIGRNPRLPLTLARLIRRLRAEVLHTHGPYAQFYGGVAARIAGGCRVVHTMHGFPWPRNWRRRLLSRLSNALTQYVVAVSHDLATYARDELKASPDRLRVIHNGIDAERFSCAAEHTGPDSEGRFAAVMVARLSSEKDFATLFQAIGLVRQKHPNFDLAIAGDGPLRPQLESQIEQLALREHVHLLGNVNDIPKLLSSSQVFVLSSHTEGLSIALLEAMAQGLPVVATAVGGNPEVVVEGETGFLVPRESPGMLADRLVWLFEHRHAAHSMGAAGRRRVEDEFDVRRMVASYEDLYSQSARRNGQHGSLLLNHTGVAAGA
jgi:sugar transferase (PEP-CTERM/EpsH1 system associated)